MPGLTQTNRQNKGSSGGKQYGGEHLWGNIVANLRQFVGG